MFLRIVVQLYVNIVQINQILTNNYRRRIISFNGLKSDKFERIQLI